jgi:hypothetical protein
MPVKEENLDFETGRMSAKEIDQEKTEEVITIKVDRYPKKEDVITRQSPKRSQSLFTSRLKALEGRFKAFRSRSMS